MRTKVLLTVILLISAFLRFYQLTSLPALNADEAAIGYNAYSLIQTGKDEHGNPWPIHFRSFNDYKPGLYFYIVMPFVAILGLGELAVRLPGALFGVASVLMVFLLVKELFKNERLALLSSFLLAVSPWHLHFSRGGWEVNVATFFITAGVWAFLRGLRERKWFYLAALSFVAALYTYHAARVVAPLLGLGLVLLYRKELFKDIKKVVFPAFAGVLLLIPLVFDFLGPAGISRAAGVGLFADEGPFWRTNEQRGQHESLRSPLSLVLHNKPVNYTLAFFENYTEHFAGDSLFMRGDGIQRNKVPDMGQLYLFDLLFLSLGLILIARKISSWKVVLLWLLVAPIPAALTFQSPHALRAQNIIIPLSIISAFGLLSLWDWARTSVRGVVGGLVVAGLVLLVSWDVTRYLHQYYFHMAKTYDFSSQYGVKELVSYVGQNQDRYEKIIVTDRYDQPYILFLFYLSYPPEKFQGAHELTARDEFGFSTVRDFDKYTFISIGDFDQMRDRYPNALIVGAADEIPFTGHVVKEIYFPSGATAFKIVSN